jgi:16S rRNA pseudouridine516 synthase
VSTSLRLDRLLANMGYGSRRDVQQMVRYGEVTLDGAPVTDSDMKVVVEPGLSARMMVHGAKLDPPPGMALMLHKPVGVTCSHKDVGPLVYKLLPERWQRRDPAISAIGRLDKDTSGLLLLTDDGTFLHQVISPRRHIPKRYLATLDRPLDGSEAEVFASGTLMLESETKPLLPATLEVMSPREVAVSLMEGRYHQVRRMFAAVKNHVTALHRVSIGGLALPDDLAPGAFIVLDEKQRDAVMMNSEGK